MQNILQPVAFNIAFYHIICPGDGRFILSFNGQSSKKLIRPIGRGRWQKVLKQTLHSIISCFYGTSLFIGILCYQARPWQKPGHGWGIYTSLLQPSTHGQSVLFLLLVVLDPGLAVATGDGYIKKAKLANALKCPKNAIISSTDQRVCLGNNAGTFQCLEPLVAPQHALLPPILNRSLWKCCNCLFQRVCLTVNLC